MLSVHCRIGSRLFFFSKVFRIWRPPFCASLLRGRGMFVDLRTHRILKADYSNDGRFQFPIEIPYLKCSYELNRLIGTYDNPGTKMGVVSTFSYRFLLTRCLDSHARRTCLDGEVAGVLVRTTRCLRSNSSSKLRNAGRNSKSMGHSISLTRN